MAESERSYTRHLNEQPEIKELTTHARTAKWFDLGIQLELDIVDLDGCTDLTHMYQLWIQEKAENGTRRNLLDALRAIRQNNVAQRYEDYIKGMCGIEISTLAFTSSQEKGKPSSKESCALMFQEYVARPEIKTFHFALEVIAKLTINGANETVDFFGKVERKLLQERFTAEIADKLENVTKFATSLGQAGETLGVAVDLLSVCGLHKYAKTDKLDQIYLDIKGLQDVDKVFREVKEQHHLRALDEFLPTFNRLQVQVDNFEKKVRKDIDAFSLYEDVDKMTETYPPSRIIFMLTRIHAFMVGRTTLGCPLFQQLTDEIKKKDWRTFDVGIAELFVQFHAVIALQIRAVRMLRSFLAHSDQDIKLGESVLTILTNLGEQRSHFDPVPYFKEYINFKLYGGKYMIKALLPDSYLYMEYGNGRVSGWSSHPGPKGYFMIEPCEGGAFRVFPKYYPGQYMCLKKDKDNGDVMYTKDKDSLQCHWFFHVINVEEKLFKLRTVKWNRYVYMQNDLYTEIRGEDKDRGKQASFKLIPHSW